MYKHSLIVNVQEAMKNNWDLPSISDYKSTPVYYSEVAKQIAKLHILYQECGIKKGDKIALCGRNSSTWAISFFSIISYGAVAVPLLHEFKPDSVHHLVNHSESKMLFVGDVVWEALDANQMPDLHAIIIMQDFSLASCKDKHYKKAHENLEESFLKKYPNGFTKDDVKYHEDKPGDLALINYTSGTTSLSKGVMLSYKAVNSNYVFARENMTSLKQGMNMISMLPMAHMYGLQFEIIFPFMVGVHIHFLTRVPSPKIIAEAFSSVKPDLIIAVPLIIEKIYRAKLKPILDKTLMKILLKTPIIDTLIQNKILNELNEAFGGRFNSVIIGGASLNQEVEAFFKKIGFRYTIGYGMTECAPLVGYEDWSKFEMYSCGKVVSGMELKIKSNDPYNEVGEILVRGDNVMMGYYKNPEATMQVLKEGWLHTGDLGLIDREGNIFIKGRTKNLILGASGQNIYPEEIEDRLNSTEYIVESIVMQQDGKLVALVYLDQDKLDNEKIDLAHSKHKMLEIREAINKDLPAYSQISYIYIQEEEFEKTPKRSIKRYLYTSINPIKK